MELGINYSHHVKCMELVVSMFRTYVNCYYLDLLELLTKFKFFTIRMPQLYHSGLGLISYSPEITKFQKSKEYRFTKFRCLLCEI